MYRAPDAEPRCLACSATTLTPWTRFDPTDGYAAIHFGIPVPNAPRGWLDGPSPTRRFNVDVARVCLTCGYVQLGLSAAALARLRAEAPGLTPLAPVPST